MTHTTKTCFSQKETAWNESFTGKNAQRLRSQGGGEKDKRTPHILSKLFEDSCARYCGTFQPIQYNSLTMSRITGPTTNSRKSNTPYSHDNLVLPLTSDESRRYP